MNLHKFRSILYFCLALLNILVSIPLITRFGPSGAAMGTALAHIIGHMLIMNIYYHLKLRINMLRFWTEMANIFIVSFGVLCICLWFKSYFPVNSLLEFLIFGTTYMLFHGFGLFFLVLKKEEKNILGSAALAIRRRLRY
jgi:O-antigen/teichoic acid export membrane protein